MSDKEKTDEADRKMLSRSESKHKQERRHRHHRHRHHRRHDHSRRRSNRDKRDRSEESQKEKKSKSKSKSKSSETEKSDNESVVQPKRSSRKRRRRSPQTESSSEDSNEEAESDSSSSTEERPRSSKRRDGQSKHHREGSSRRAAEKAVQESSGHRRRKRSSSDRDEHESRKAESSREQTEQHSSHRSDDAAKRSRSSRKPDTSTRTEHSASRARDSAPRCDDSGRAESEQFRTVTASQKRSRDSTSPTASDAEDVASKRRREQVGDASSDTKRDKSETRTSRSTRRSAEHEQKTDRERERRPERSEQDAQKRSEMDREKDRDRDRSRSDRERERDRDRRRDRTDSSDFREPRLVREAQQRARFECEREAAERKLEDASRSRDRNPEELSFRSTESECAIKSEPLHVARGAVPYAYGKPEIAVAAERSRLFDGLETESVSDVELDSQIDPEFAGSSRRALSGAKSDTNGAAHKPFYAEFADEADAERDRRCAAEFARRSNDAPKRNLEFLRFDWPSTLTHAQSNQPINHIDTLTHQTNEQTSLQTLFNLLRCVGVSRKLAGDALVGEIEHKMAITTNGTFERFHDPIAVVHSEREREHARLQHSAALPRRLDAFRFSSCMAEF